MALIEYFVPIAVSSLYGEYYSTLRTSRLTRDGTAEPVSRDQILSRERGQGNNYFSCSADNEQDWQPYSVDLYSATCDDYAYMHTVFPDGFFLPCDHGLDFDIKLINKWMPPRKSGGIP